MNLSIFNVAFGLIYGFCFGFNYFAFDIEDDYGSEYREHNTQILIGFFAINIAVYEPLY